MYACYVCIYINIHRTGSIAKLLSETFSAERESAVFMYVCMLCMYIHKHISYRFNSKTSFGDILSRAGEREMLYGTDNGLVGQVGVHTFTIHTYMCTCCA